MRIDLHTHSRVSDGTDSPAELVARAAALGLDVVALTDHDTADGWGEAARAADEHGVTLVRGMEISTRFEEAPHRPGVHLLAYLPDAAYTPLTDELDRVLVGRESRVPLMLARLRELGIDVSDTDVAAAAGDTAATGRPHIADALVTLGVVGNRDEAFDRFLAAGRPAYVDRYAAPLLTVIRLVAEAGGVSVIAHPWGRTRRQPDEAQLAVLKEAGLAGIEVDHQDHPPETRARLRAVARELDLVVTGSSDYHGAGKTDHELGCNTTAPEQYERLLDLAAAAAERAGRSATGRVPDLASHDAPQIGHRTSGTPTMEA